MTQDINAEFEQFKKLHKEKTEGAISDTPIKKEEVSSPDNTKEEIETLKSQMALLMKRNEDLAKEKEKESEKAEKYKQSLEQKEDIKNETAVNDVIKGFPETFKKDYEFNIVGQDEPYKVHIELRPMNVADISKLQQAITYTTNGQNKYFDETYQELFEAVEVFSVAGIDVPDELLDVNKIFRLDIPVTIYREYWQWLESFRLSRRF